MMNFNGFQSHLLKILKQSTFQLVYKNIMRNGNLLVEFQEKPLYNTWMGLENEYHNLVSTIYELFLL